MSSHHRFLIDDIELAKQLDGVANIVTNEVWFIPHAVEIGFGHIGFAWGNLRLFRYCSELKSYRIHTKKLKEGDNKKPKEFIKVTFENEIKLILNL